MHEFVTHPYELELRDGRSDDIRIIASGLVLRTCVVVIPLERCDEIVAVDGVVVTDLPLVGGYTLEGAEISGIITHGHQRNITWRHAALQAGSSWCGRRLDVRGESKSMIVRR